MRTLDVLLRYGPGTRPARLACTAVPELIWANEDPVELDPGAAAALAIASHLDEGPSFAGVAMPLRSALSLYDAHVDWEAGIDDLEDDQARDAALRALGIAMIAAVLFPDDPVGELLEHEYGEGLVDWLVADLVLSQSTGDEPPEEGLAERLLEYLDDLDLPEPMADREDLGRSTLSDLAPALEERVMQAAPRVDKLALRIRDALGEGGADQDTLADEARELPVYELLTARLVAERGSDGERERPEPEPEESDPRLIRLAAIRRVLPGLKERLPKAVAVEESAVDRSALDAAEQALTKAEATAEQGAGELDLGIVERAKAAARGAREARNDARRAVQTQESAIAQTKADLDRIRRKQSANRAKSRALVEARLMESKAVRMRVQAERAEVDTTPVQKRIDAIAPEIAACEEERDALPYIVAGEVDVDQWPLNQAEAQLYEAELEAKKHPRPEPPDPTAHDEAAARRDALKVEVDSLRAEHASCCRGLAGTRVAIRRQAADLARQAKRLTRVRDGIGEVAIEDVEVSKDRLAAAEAAIEEGYRLYEQLPEAPRLDTRDRDRAAGARARKAEAVTWARIEVKKAELATVHTRWALAKQVPARAASLSERLADLRDQRGSIEVIEVDPRTIDRAPLVAAEAALAEASGVEFDQPTLDESPRTHAGKRRRAALEARLDATREIRRVSRGIRATQVRIRDVSLDGAAARGEKLQLYAALESANDPPDRSRVLEATTALRRARRDAEALAEQLDEKRARIQKLDQRLEDLEDHYDDIMRLRGLRRRRVRIMEQDLPVPAPPPKPKAAPVGLVESKTTMMSPEEIQAMLAELEN